MIYRAGLGFILLSYGDKLGVTVTGRKYAFPELEDLRRLDALVHDEFQSLFKAVALTDLEHSAAETRVEIST